MENCKSAHTGGTMATISYICIVWITICVETLSSVRHVNVSATVGSTVVLPCELTSADPKMPRIRWGTIEELVFERKGGESFQGERYQGRVDVPLDELRKGNCSLVLHNLSLSDAGTYTMYNTRRFTPDRTSHYSTPEEFQIGKVELLVSSEVMKSPHPLVLVLSLVSWLLVQLFCR